MLKDVRYTASAEPLHTLDLWLPSSISGPEPVIFVVYIHGGAWSDPLQDKIEGTSLLNHIASRTFPGDNIKVACASLNYRLSTANNDVKHPDHMNDVLTALEFLKRNYDLQNCVLVGHSAGATLAVQVFHDFRREVLGMILFNGIYDLETLVDEYPDYNGFVTAAFGPLDSSDWYSPSPTNIMRNTPIKPEHLHERVLLAHSFDDELLSMNQTDEFEAVLNKVWGEPIERVVISGKHDDSPASVEMQEITQRTILHIARKLTGNSE